MTAILILALAWPPTPDEAAECAGRFWAAVKTLPPQPAPPVPPKVERKPATWAELERAALAARFLDRLLRGPW